MSEELNINTEAVSEEPLFTEVVGVCFKDGGKIYYFAPNGTQAKIGEFAIVETSRGLEFGKVASQNKQVKTEDVVQPLRKVVRIATKEDIAVNEENKKKEAEALKICQVKINEHGLEMKLIESEYTFDCSKLTFYFTADGRIDFRDLVKDLASTFRTRIELRQIGIRDEAKFMGGLGICGRPFCCSSFLPDFVQVSIKMAKEQNLSLNSAKISGACGRLMCCLRYEYDTYLQEAKLTPPINSTVKTEDGIGTVIEANTLRGLLKVSVNDTVKTYHRDNVKVISNTKSKKPSSNPDSDSSEDESK
ncbi:MAG: stage 0 sporulation family protein [Clostridia bacterium]|nr:stage 0 sporulation family protein [Clostridia bacterium]